MTKHDPLDVAIQHLLDYNRVLDGMSLQPADRAKLERIHYRATLEPLLGAQPRAKAKRMSSAKRKRETTDTRSPDYEECKAIAERLGLQVPKTVQDTASNMLTALLAHPDGLGKWALGKICRAQSPLVRPALDLLEKLGMARYSDEPRTSQGGKHMEVWRATDRAPSTRNLLQRAAVN